MAVFVTITSVLFIKNFNFGLSYFLAALSSGHQTHYSTLDDHVMYRGNV